MSLTQLVVGTQLSKLVVKEKTTNSPTLDQASNFTKDRIEVRFFSFLVISLFCLWTQGYVVAHVGVAMAPRCVTRYVLVVRKRCGCCSVTFLRGLE